MMAMIMMMTTTMISTLRYYTVYTWCHQTDTTNNASHRRSNQNKPETKNLLHKKAAVLICRMSYMAITVGIARQALITLRPFWCCWILSFWWWSHLASHYPKRCFFKEKKHTVLVRACILWYMNWQSWQVTGKLCIRDCPFVTHHSPSS